MNYLNLGCGCRFHPEWTNIDFTSTGKGVIAHNLTQGILFPDVSFDVIYHSHLLEHFPKTAAESFLKECWRVLRPQGVLRLAVPDLEQIARTYLLALEQARLGSQEWAANYEWIVLEMYDQTVRNYSGGDMAAYLSKEHIPNKEFVLKRCGTEAKNLIEAGHLQRQNPQPVPEAQPKRLLKQIYRFCRYSGYRQELLLKILLGQEYSALEIGRFRKNGEVHQWMYDCYSLSVLLEKCSFQDIIQRTAAESYIPGWVNFNLDTELDGTAYKPDSIYIEAIKPAP
jgi:predicted SAM-dependent methyltransferase